MTRQGIRMAGTLPTTSTPLPSWSQLNFSRNCTAYGQWLSAFISPNTWNRADSLGGSIPLSIELFNSALPEGWVYTSNQSGTPTNWTLGVSTAAEQQYFGDVLKWFTTHLYSTYNATEGQWYVDIDFVDNVVWDPADKCPNAFCKAIAFTGNADISGIGIIVSYYIEAALTTLYLVVFTTWRAKKWMARKRQMKTKEKGGTGDPESVASPASSTSHRNQPGFFRRALNRLFDALRGSLDSLHMTATLFAFAVLTAAIVMAAKHAQDHRRHPVDFQNLPSGNALYDSALGLLVGLYSVFPVVTLYALLPQQAEVATPHSHLSHRGGRAGMRRGVLVILWGLAAALVYITPSSELDYEFQGHISAGHSGEDSDYASALYACDQRGGRMYWQVLRALKFIVIGVPMLWAIITGALYLLTLKWTLKSMPKTQTQTRRPSRRTAARNAWRHFFAWINCAIMWSILGCLIHLRQDIIDVADGLDSENSWAFGQILSIASWGPVGVDFAFLLLFGIEDGLGGRLPLDFTIRQVNGNSRSQLPSSPSSSDPHISIVDSSKTNSSEEMPAMVDDNAEAHSIARVSTISRRTPDHAVQDPSPSPALSKTSTIHSTSHSTGVPGAIRVSSYDVPVDKPGQGGDQDGDQDGNQDGGHA
ncbi:hypothetical protein F503_06117 [Ophiostoma piceae UAMH 11346]|uniref:Uncharacterized protein n=1 Tax=Ophiostoma piceae (strain UAMH 11346) TaxID=1262450 RepID=S3BS65_OPHP1|nr:hypothetical protein F503_06117 [Ophiostoma piceae UAMH 11346]